MKYNFDCFERHPGVPHTSEHTKGTICDGCASLEVLIRRRNRKETEHYWCESRHGYIHPRDVDNCEIRAR